MVKEAPRRSASLSETSVIDPFEKFAGLPFYVDLNSRFIDIIGLEKGQRVVDLACGPGNIGELIIPKIRLDGELIEIDFSPTAIQAAKRNLGRSAVNQSFFQGRAEDISTILDGFRGEIDAVVCGNAIHNFTDKSEVTKAVYDLLKRGGRFAFNTTFYRGSFSKGEMKGFYIPWIREAKEIAKNRDPLSDGVKEEKVEAALKNQLSADEYKRILVDAGFGYISIIERPVEVPMEGFAAISEDPEFLRGSLPQFPAEIATDALQLALDKFRNAGTMSSVRNWLEVVAVKH